MKRNKTIKKFVDIYYTSIAFLFILSFLIVLSWFIPVPDVVAFLYQIHPLLVLFVFVLVPILPLPTFFKRVLVEIKESNSWKTRIAGSLIIVAIVGVFIFAPQPRQIVSTAFNNSKSLEVNKSNCAITEPSRGAPWSGELLVLSNGVTANEYWANGEVKNRLLFGFAKSSKLKGEKVALGVLNCKSSVEVEFIAFNDIVVSVK